MPLLYSTEMVKAKLAMRKTETRRIIKPQPIIDEESGYVYDGRHKTLYKNDMHHEDWRIGFIADHARWKKGDLIWGRETWQLIVEDMDAEEWTQIVRYAADNPEPIYERDGDGFQIFNKDGSEKFIGFKPSIHMPKSIARIWDEVVEVRVERLHDITDEGAIAEGIQKVSNHNQWYNYLHPKGEMPAEMWVRGAKESYKTLWQKINGVDSWEANPWVWVIKTKQLSVTGRPEGV